MYPTLLHLLYYFLRNCWLRYTYEGMSCMSCSFLGIYEYYCCYTMTCLPERRKSAKNDLPLHFGLITSRVRRRQPKKGGEAEGEKVTKKSPFITKLDPPPFSLSLKGEIEGEKSPLWRKICTEKVVLSTVLTKAIIQCKSRCNRGLPSLEVRKM